MNHALKRPSLLKVDVIRRSAFRVHFYIDAFVPWLGPWIGSHDLHVVAPQGSEPARSMTQDRVFHAKL